MLWQQVAKVNGEETETDLLEGQGLLLEKVSR